LTPTIKQTKLRRKKRP